MGTGGDESESCSQLICRLASDDKMRVPRSNVRFIGAALIAAASITFVDCGDPKAQPTPIALTFNQSVYPLPSSLAIGSTAATEVTISNDNQNAGVNFSCAPASECGTFTPASTGSNVPSCYQTPAAVPPGGTVTITATSATDPTKSVSSPPITISTIDPVSGCTP